MSAKRKEALSMFSALFLAGFPSVMVVIVYCGLRYIYPGDDYLEVPMTALSAEADARFQPSIAEYLAVLNKPVRESVKYIAVTDDPWHYRIPCGGHCHENGLICLKSDTAQWRPQAVWHEAWHAYHFRIGIGPEGDFSRKWIVVQGGELTDYATQNYTEDLAEWGQEIHSALAGRWSAFDEPGFFGGDLSAERQKFALICEYGFLNSDQAARMLKKYPALAATPR